MFPRNSLIAKRMSLKRVSKKISRSDNPGIKAKAWLFLNSTFGIWLLSATLVTGVGALYTKWQNDRLTEQARRQKVAQLDLEIAYRLSQILYRAAFTFDLIISWNTRKFILSDLEFNGGESDKIAELKSEISEMSESLKDTRHPFFLLDRNESTELSSLYPEFKEMSVRGLVVELRRHVLAEDVPAIDNVIEVLMSQPIDIKFTHASRRVDAGEHFCSVSKILLNQVAHVRWAETPFSNLSCNKDSPFCTFDWSASTQKRQFPSKFCNPSTSGSFYEQERIFDIRQRK